MESLVGLSGRYLFRYVCMLCISREVIFTKKNMHSEQQPLGKAVRKLAALQDESELTRIRKRFTVFATSADMEECAYYLRGLVQLLRAKGVPMDYIQLAYDLYQFQTENGAQKVKLRWGQDFYRVVKQEEEEKENE